MFLRTQNNVKRILIDFVENNILIIHLGMMDQMKDINFFQLKFF